MILVGLYALGVLLDFAVYAPALWRFRRLIAALGATITMVVGLWLVLFNFGIWSLLLALVALYRMFNNARIIEQRMHERYLYKATFRTMVTLALAQVVILLSWAAWDKWLESTALWAVAVAVQLAAAAVICSSVVRRLRRTQWPTKTISLSDNELPTVTVAIPARNETEDLAACLRSVLASNYSKLEVLVLDDCSQNKRTSEIIKAFAHDGVRFIQGEAPRSTWLAKNQAYDHLAREASGDFILFCGVDVRFAPNSIRQLVATVQDRHKKMLCVLPWRSSTAKGFALTQAMRYWWELAPPRRLFERPPVLSSCWIIETKALKKAGGFPAIARSIVPEAFFARTFVATDEYSFLRASAKLGIESVKGVPAQQATALRTRYPQVHRRPENALLFVLIELVFFVLPFAFLLAGFWINIGLVAQLLALLTVVLLVVSYELLSLATRTGNWWFGLVGLPVGTLYDIGLLHYSMWQYEFSTVEWKGRNICIPAMHVIPHLPSIDGTKIHQD